MRLRPIAKSAKFVITLACSIFTCMSAYAWEKNKCSDIKDAYFYFKGDRENKPYMSMRAWVIPSPLQDRVNYELTLSNLIKKPPRSLPSLDCHWQQLTSYVDEYGYVEVDKVPVNCVNPKTGRIITQIMYRDYPEQKVPDSPEQIPSKDDKDIDIRIQNYFYQVRNIALCLKKKHVRYQLGRAILLDKSLGYVKERELPFLLFLRVESEIYSKALMKIPSF